MIKRLAILTRRGDFSPDAFQQYWRGPHGDLAKAMPRLARYNQNLVLQRLDAGSPLNPEIDGFAELWFANPDDMQAAFASTPGLALPDDEKAFLGAITILAVEERVVGARQAPIKVFVLTSEADTQASEPVCAVNHVSDTFTNPDLRPAPITPTSVVELRFNAKADVDGWIGALKRERGGAILAAFALQETQIC